MENRKYIVLGAVGGFILLLLFPLLLGSCMKGCSSPARPKNSNVNKAHVVNETKSLVVWGLYDDISLYKGVFDEFQTNNHITIEYHKFTDPEAYRDLLINEIAEGKGPDVAMVNNTWVLGDKNKLLPFPAGQGGWTVQKYTGTDGFVKVAQDDLILPDDSGTPQIYGFPASVDTLALYYNEKWLREMTPSQPIPSDVWTSEDHNDFANQVAKINKTDLSFERFFLSGVAMGRSDNITKAVDIMSLLLLQYGTQLYDDKMQRVRLADAFTSVDPDTNVSQTVYPAKNALTLYTKFGISDEGNIFYAWNDMITKKEMGDYEVGAFASGKVAMIFGYSYTMDQIHKLIEQKRNAGKATIDPSEVKIAPVPQATSKPIGKISFANYYPFVVPRNSKYPKESWDLILALVDKKSQEYYWQQAHKPTSLSSLIDTEAQDPVYQAFGIQVGYAQSLRLTDPLKFSVIVKNMITDVLNGGSIDVILKNATAKLQCLLNQYNQTGDQEGVNCMAEKSQ
jgi:ABC-type glycerol-3-phosphate transport system substrate-binding protein